MMKEFMLLFGGVYEDVPGRTPEERQAMAQKWQDWVRGIAAQNKFVAPGQRLALGGKVINPNGVITDGPYTEAKI
jgi:hypothetical protein